MLSYITLQLQAFKLLDFVQKRAYELDFLAAGMLFQLLAWLDGQLKTKPEVVIQQLLSGGQLFYFTFIKINVIKYSQNETYLLKCSFIFKENVVIMKTSAILLATNF